MDSRWNPSETSSIEITCPECGNVSPFTIWSIINTQDNPETLSELIKGDLYTFACPTCGYQTIVSHPCLYLDPAHSVFIYNTANDPEMKQQAERAFNDLKKQDANLESTGIFRIVKGHQELADKAAIFAEELDDRAMEVLKLIVVSYAVSEHRISDKVPCSVYFLGANEEKLAFRLESEAEGKEQNFISSLSLGAYQVLLDSLKETTVLNEHSYYFDSTWATQAVQKMETDRAATAE